jgi:hypothetical protein
MSSQRTARLIIEFPAQEEAAEWFKAARACGHIPPNTALYRPDGLDMTRRAEAGSLIVKRMGDRPYGLLPGTEPTKD